MIQFNLSIQVGELKLYCLEFANGLTKLIALLSVAQSFVQTCLGQADGESRNGNPPPVQYLHELFEAVPALTEDVAFGHNAILEGQRARIRGLPSHFLVRVADDIAWGTLWHDNIRDLVVPIGALTSNGGGNDATADTRASLGGKAISAIAVPRNTH